MKQYSLLEILTRLVLYPGEPLPVRVEERVKRGPWYNSEDWVQ